jgi:hypothetical protein
VAVRIFDLLARGSLRGFISSRSRLVFESHVRPPLIAGFVPVPGYPNAGPLIPLNPCQAATGCVQALHRVAVRGMISLHCGHSCVVGFVSPGFGMKAFAIM